MVTATRFGPYQHDLRKQGGLKKDQVHGTWYGPDRRFEGATVVATAYPLRLESTLREDWYVTVRNVLIKTHTRSGGGDISTPQTEIGINVLNLGDVPLEGYTLFFDVFK